MTLRSRRDRILGCILGGALGDAWGAPYEGQPAPIAFEIPTALAVTDDTEFTLATCEAILCQRPVSPEVVSNHLLERYRNGRVRGIGASTLKAMRDLDAGAHWALSGARGERAAGNGAAMRAAPLGFVLDPDSSPDRTILRDVARITHHSDEAYVGALAVVVAVRMAARQAWGSPTTFAEVATALPQHSAVRRRMEEILAWDPTAGCRAIADRFGSSGWAVDSVPLAIYAASRIVNHSLDSVLQDAIEAGGDTDTIASIAGQITGTYVGASAIPESLFCAIDGIDSILDTANRFAQAVASSA